MHKRLVTKESLKEIFLNLGISEGSSVMVHASLGGIGYLINGPDDIIDSLLDIIGASGNILFPSHTRQYTDPGQWQNPPVPKQWVEIIRDEMNQFDPKRSPIERRGILGDAFLRYPGVCRSSHPLNSTAVIGKDAKYFTEEHPIHASEGIGSPCFKLYESEGYVLLLGVSMEAATVIHTAEFLADVPYLLNSDVKVLVKEHKKNKFIKMEKYPGTSEYFEKLRPLLKNINALNEFDLDGYPITYFSVKHAIDISLEILLDDPYFLVRE
jgi:aminoglycoside 3-N-acetyltransferase